MSGLGICLHSFLGPPLPPRTKARGPEPRGSHYEMTKTATGSPCSCQVNGQGEVPTRVRTGGRLGLIHVCTISWLRAGLLRLRGGWEPSTFQSEHR